MIIPWQELSPDTLTNLIESFVLREGTDYGDSEKILSEKVLDIKNQLVQGSIVIIWSELHQSMDIKPIDKFR